DRRDRQGPPHHRGAAAPAEPAGGSHRALHGCEWMRDAGVGCRERRSGSVLGVHAVMMDRITRRRDRWPSSCFSSITRALQLRYTTRRLTLSSSTPLSATWRNSLSG